MTLWSSLSPKSGVRKNTSSKSEADSASSAAVGILAGGKKKESSRRSFDSCKVIEAKTGKDGSFRGARVVLIEEGMGNFGSCMYYTRSALESAVPVFEGKKFMIDHPTLTEEEDRPERSIRDVAGHYENIAVEDGEGGQALLCGDLIVVEGDSFRDVRDIIEHAVKYAQKFPDKQFIGLSINAAGEHEPADLEEFMKQSEIPAGALPKLELAAGLGVEKLNVVSKITDAVSCDLVTEAGAGGRIQKLLESKRSSQMSGKKKPTKTRESEGNADGGHDDAAQDVELIKSMLKKHMGDDAAEDEANHEAMKQAADFYKKEGMEGEAAYEAAAQAMKCAATMQAKKEADAKAAEGDAAQEAEEGAGGEEEETTKKESAQKGKGGSVKTKESKGGEITDEHKNEVIELRAKVARLEEADRARSIEKYVDDMLASSKLPRNVTKEFREALGKPKSKEEAKKLFERFEKIFKMGGAGSESETVPFVETDRHVGGAEGSGFGDCVTNDEE